MKLAFLVNGLISSAMSKLEGAENHPAWGILDEARKEIRGWQEAIDAECKASAPGVVEALRGALEGLEEMIGYVPEYFRNKWGHQDYIDRAKQALAALKNQQEKK